MAAMIEICGNHPYADKFPMLPDSELADLAESIVSNGLRNPIVITIEGLILDGRNRHVACEKAGVEADVIVYEGDDLAEYVIDCNSSRRHMSTGARAMSTALVLEADGRRENGRWLRGTVDKGPGTDNDGWKVALKRAGTILDFKPDLAEQVISEEIPLKVAFEKACEARDAERRKLEEAERRAVEEADAKAFVEENAPDLAALVGDTLESYAEAQAVWEKRNREEAERIRREKAEEQKRLAAEKAARSDMYTQMAIALQTCSAYGRYDSVTNLMSEYRPDELSPTTLSVEFTRESLTRAQHFINGLLEWTES